MLPQALAPSCEDRVDLAALHGADTVRTVGHAGVIAHFTAPGDNIVEGKTGGCQHMIDDHVQRMVRLAPQRHPQRKLTLANIAK